jgi:hypothetical protein
MKIAKEKKTHLIKAHDAKKKRTRHTGEAESRNKKLKLTPKWNQEIRLKKKLSNYLIIKKKIGRIVLVVVVVWRISMRKEKNILRKSRKRL